MAVSLTLQSTHNNNNIDNSSDHSHSPASLPPPTPLSPHDPYHRLSNSSNTNGSRPGTADSASKQSISSPAATNATNATAEKRKTSRRANTAERRATHNAVERQRRETLNGRFLVRIHPSTAYIYVYLYLLQRIYIGPRRSPPKPNLGPPPLKVSHRQLLHRPNSLPTSLPRHRGPRAPHALLSIPRPQGGM